ncbi:MAG: DNA-processing protein DprA [Prolixibacteraceae bacterium]|nr:DNA-processing protein DprA [Prolixibacteraceae bacterium]MBN2649702.1 DNA-processing protein DprA [Prolixibacteraceae bacterium]
MSSPLIYKIALSLFNRIGSVNARRLVAYMGSLDAVFESSKKQFKDIPGIGTALINIVVNSRDEVLKKAGEEVKFIEKHKLKTFFYLDKNYPRRLAQCVDSPAIMYMKGEVNLDHSRIISVVGTRKASEYGRERTQELISGLAAQGVHALVVSGLAFGIDVNAHKAAMKCNLPTLGVVGHGLDKMYPAEHAKIAREIIQENGGLLSDFPSNHKIDPGNFLRRNRIIAGLADCTIVVESAAKGGALVTADIANSYNRDVFAYPGRTTDEYSAGCNAMIKNNKAALIESSSDLIAYMGWEARNEPVQQALLIDLNDEEEQIISALKQNEVSTTDFISREVHLPVQKINSLLLTLEFKGAVKSLPGNRFKLIGNIGR